MWTDWPAGPCPIALSPNPISLLTRHTPKTKHKHPPHPTSDFHKYPPHPQNTNTPHTPPHPISPHTHTTYSPPARKKTKYYRYELEWARAMEAKAAACEGAPHETLPLLGRALKRYGAVEKHFADFAEDQFDFHGYCVRKGTLRAYVDVLRCVLVVLAGLGWVGMGWDGGKMPLSRTFDCCGAPFPFLHPPLPPTPLSTPLSTNQSTNQPTQLTGWRTNYWRTRSTNARRAGSSRATCGRTRRRRRWAGGTRGASRITRA